ncbi:hypothetical protein M404DRAFT_1000354 [Pisolithus tinctorius Marx 270]|uniref:Uncharacterized protein n=1 Tax=Pisolithus tinctorius Marx 270 TaxID=870435 RepID=A0A0C3J6Z7_PISTI|nr:hypothetical protein M404DRAFT_1000354 [Pisolithus tinctorius Marx 270]
MITYQTSSVRPAQPKVAGPEGTPEIRCQARNYSCNFSTLVVHFARPPSASTVIINVLSTLPSRLPTSRLMDDVECQ